MNQEEQNYLDLLKEILETGNEQLDRTKVGTLSIFGSKLKFSLENNKIPLLTTKKMAIKGIIEELLFFIRGETNTKLLEEKGSNIWRSNTTREFLDSKGLNHLPEGDMGKGYGFQWRNFGGEKAKSYTHFDKPGVDQINNLIDSLKNDPFGRRHIISAWNPSQLHEMALPPCHTHSQWYVNSKNELSCQFYMRSSDAFLGLPFNVASYGIFTHILAKTLNLKAKEVIFIGGNTHIYKNHIDQVNQQIVRIPYDFPYIHLTKNISSIEDIESLEFKDFIINNYNFHPVIKADMAI